MSRLQCCIVLCLGISLAGCGIDLSTLGQNAPQPADPAQQAGNAPPVPIVQPAAAQTGGSTVAASAIEVAPADPNDPAAGLYGAQGGEQTIPAAQAAADAPLRARSGDTFFKLSNATMETGRFGRPLLSVFYEITHKGEYGGVNLIIRTPDGEKETVMLMGPFWDNKGEIEIEDSFPTPFSDSSFPKNFEVYLVRSEHRYGPDWRREFKVSNSVTIGAVPNLTFARNWTPDEAARYRQPFPDYTNPNAHKDVGTLTEYVGNPKGGGEQRYVSPEGRLLGVEYRPGEWDGEKCIGQLVCVFDRDQPTTLPERVIANEGYVVGAVNTHANRFVNAVQLVFMKVGTDGRLDPSDSYTSDWLGFQGSGEPQTMGGDGRPVIGLSFRQGAILDGLALVQEE